METNEGKKPTEKEVYKLWREYLKRSVNFQIYIYMTLNVDKELIKRKSPSKFNFQERVYKHYQKLFSVQELKLQDLVWLANMHDNMQEFGDVIVEPFSEWWRRRKIKTRLPIVDLSEPDSRQNLQHYESECRILIDEHFKNKKSIDPQDVLSLLVNSESDYVFVGIPIAGKISAEHISKEIVKIRRRRVKDERYGQADATFRRFSEPVSRIRFEELKTYLKVYDLKEDGLKMKEIIAKLEPGRKGDPVIIMRIYRGYLKKAKDVIRSVEVGFFPSIPEQMMNKPSVLNYHGVR